MMVQMSPRTTADFPSTTSLALMLTNLICNNKVLTTGMKPGIVVYIAMASPIDAMNIDFK